MKKKLFLLAAGAAALAGAAAVFGPKATRYVSMKVKGLHDDKPPAFDPECPSEGALECVGQMLMAELREDMSEAMGMAAACRRDAARELLLRSRMEDGKVVVDNDVVEDILDKMATGAYLPDGCDACDGCCGCDAAQAPGVGADGVDISMAEADRLMPKDMVGDYLDFEDGE